MKNLLFIGVDQLRYDVVGANKAVPTDTPNMDALIAAGASFSRTYATCPLCTPSRASMFTGDYAFRHGMGTNCDMYHALGTELAEPERLLHKDLQRAGYRCSFVGKWHAGLTKSPADYGFDSDSPAGYGSPSKMADFQHYLTSNDLRYSIEPKLFFNPDQQTMAAGRWRGSVQSTTCYHQTNQAIEKLDMLSANDEPFFLSLQYWDPHGPHLIPDEFWGHTDRSSLKPWSSFTDSLDGKPSRIKRERDDFYRLHPRSEKDLIEYIGLYFDHIALLDSQIGRLMDFLRDSGLLDDTLVVFTSDHGDMTGAHGGLIDKGLPYEEAMRVPMVFANPAIEPNDYLDLALNMDILPTALGLLGVPFEQRQALDLSNLIKGTQNKGRDSLLAEYHGLRFLYSQRILVSGDNWKYVFSPGDYDELYDLNSDPGELRNLISDPASQPKLDAMRQCLLAETAAFDDPLRDCVSKFNGSWRTESGQFDATSDVLTDETVA